MVAVPLSTEVTTPELFTVAMEVLFDEKLTVLLVAFVGNTVAASC